MTPAWRDAFAALDRGAISPQIALARLILSGDPPTPERLSALADAPARAALAELARTHVDRLAALSRIAGAGLDPEGADMVAATAALFDRLAGEEPEAAVAFYSLGDPRLLAAATDELAGVIRAWTPVAGRDLLDLGCGIGRVAIALAPEAGSVIGIDVSAAMVAQARARAGDRPNLRFEQGDGRGLAGFADASVDAVLAVDCFPYLVRAGAAVLDRHLAEIARVLRPGGDLLVFNWSYRGDAAADLAEAEAPGHGLVPVRLAEQPFAIWDATGFHLRRAP